MQITVNGNRHELTGPLTLSQLLNELQVQAHTGVAVLRNGEIVRKAQWAETAVEADDELEIVRATQGG